LHKDFEEEVGPAIYEEFAKVGGIEFDDEVTVFPGDGASDQIIDEQIQIPRFYARAGDALPG
jgi:hypothetical protein